MRVTFRGYDDESRVPAFRGRPVRHRGSNLVNVSHGFDRDESIAINGFRFAQHSDVFTIFFRRDEGRNMEIIFRRIYCLTLVLLEFRTNSFLSKLIDRRNSSVKR